MNDMVSRSYQLLPPLERAAYFQKVINSEGISKADLARRYNRSLSYISNSIRLINLPDLVKEGLTSGMISEGHARALLTVHDKNRILPVYKKVISSNATVRECEKWARESNIQSDHQ